MKSGDPVYVQSTKTLYFLATDIWRVGTYNMNWVLADATRYTQATGLTLTGGYYLDTATSQTSHGDKGFFGTLTAYGTLRVKGQTITQDNLNRLDFANSIQVNDTAFIGANQYLFQKNTNGIKGEGSFTIPDTMFLGSGQYLFQNTVNGIKVNNSFTAADTVFGNVVTSAGNLSATGITGSTLPTFTIASGQVIPVLVYDTIGFAVSGLTTASIVLCSYAEAVPTADTIATVYSVKTGWLTLMGENGKKINYWIPKK
jgi:hypothetical protein